MVKFSAKLARLLSRSPVRTFPVAVVVGTDCPAAEILLAAFTFPIGIKILTQPSKPKRSYNTNKPKKKNKNQKK